MTDECRTPPRASGSRFLLPLSRELRCQTGATGLEPAVYPPGFAYDDRVQRELQRLLEFVDVVNSVHLGAKETVTIVDLVAAEIEEADVARDQLPRAYMPGIIAAEFRAEP